MCLHPQLNNNFSISQNPDRMYTELRVCSCYSLSIHCVHCAIVDGEDGVLSFTAVFLSFFMSLMNISLPEVKKVNTLWFGLVIMVFSSPFLPKF